LSEPRINGDLIDFLDLIFGYSCVYSFIAYKRLLARASTLVTKDGVESPDSTGLEGQDWNSWSYSTIVAVVQPPPTPQSYARYLRALVLGSPRRGTPA